MSKYTKVFTPLLLSAMSFAQAGTMGDIATPRPYYVYGGAQVGFAASNTSNYRFINTDVTSVEIFSKGRTDASNALTADLGLGLPFFNHAWTWRSALQYMYTPKTVFSTVQRLSGFVNAAPPVVSIAVLSTNTNTLFWNNSLQKEVLPFLNLYVQGGIGATQNAIKGYQLFYDPTAPLVNSDGSFTGSNVTHFAWNAGAGAWIDINERVSLDFNYTYVSFGKFLTRGGLILSPNERISINMNSNVFLFGVRYKFIA